MIQKQQKNEFFIFFGLVFVCGADDIFFRQTTSHSYTYGDGTWKDLLTKFDGQSISYDGAGNPTSYYNGSRWTFSWEEGRRLMSASKSGGASLTFTYDSEGLRLTKKVGSTTYSYIYAGGKLMRQTWGSNTLDFFYDSAGVPYALKYNGTLYYYITNLQGDVLHIVNTSGTPVVSYTYDPYGKPEDPTGTEATTLGVHNPLRYRGYIYDTETGLYYLQSRYYDPGTGRFINADGYASTGQGITGCNMFAYCLNNPVCMIDLSGKDAIYVVDYGPDGLPIVGHSRLYIQDEEGNWYMTQYAGQFPYPSTARIQCDVPTGMYEEELNQILNNNDIDKKRYIYIEGDFSESYKVAESLDGSNYGGYSLLFNNCMHYNREILTYGEFENPALEATLYASPALSPHGFFVSLVNAQLTGVVHGTGTRYDGTEWQFWRESYAQ